MISIIKSTDESVRVLELFEELLNGLPQGTATLESKRTKNDDGTIIRLAPENKHAAQFGAHTEDGGLFLIDVFFGSGTTFELENGDVDELLELVRRLGQAVISGRCEQRFGFLGYEARSDWTGVEYIAARIISIRDCIQRPCAMSLTIMRPPSRNESFLLLSL